MVYNKYKKEAAAVSINYLEEKEREDKITLLCKSLEWHRRSINYTFTQLMLMENFAENYDEKFEKAAKRFEKIVAELAEFDKELAEKAGWI